MPIELIDVIKPKNAGDFPMVEDENLQGSFRAVTTVAERDAITDSHRKEGMRVRISSERRSYELSGGITNSDWVEVEVATNTETDLTIPVDYNDVSAVDPPASLRFWSQAQVDAFLTDNSATSFRHFELVWDAVVGSVGHVVTFNIAAGIHRPVPLPTAESFRLTDKQFTTGGYIRVVGPVPSAWDLQAGVSGLTVDAFTGPTSLNPSLDFSTSHPGIFSGLDLRGNHVVTNTGQAITIRDHTNDVLFVTGAVSGSPATASVARPSGIFRSSLDDVAVVGTNTMFRYNLSGPTSSPNAANIEWENIRFDNFGLGAQLVNSGSLRFQDCLVDHELQRSSFGINPNGRAVQFGGGTGDSLKLLGFGVRSDAAIGSSGEPVFAITLGNKVDIENSAFYGVRRGVTIANGELFQLINSSIRDTGDQTGFALQLDNTVFFLVDRTFFLQGCNPRISGQRLELLNGSRSFFNFFTRVEIDNVIGTPAVFISGASIDLSAADPGGFIQGTLANTDIGIEVPTSSRRATVELNSTTNVTGTTGDTRFDGVVRTYATVVSTGPITDVPFNLIDKA